MMSLGLLSRRVISDKPRDVLSSAGSLCRGPECRVPGRAPREKVPSDQIFVQHGTLRSFSRHRTAEIAGNDKMAQSNGIAVNIGRRIGFPPTLKRRPLPEFGNRSSGSERTLWFLPMFGIPLVRPRQML